MTDTTFTVQSDSSIVVYFVLPSVRYADTAVIRFNNDWTRWEPVGTTPTEPLKTYIEHRNAETPFPLNHPFAAAQVSFFAVAATFFVIRLLLMIW